MNETVKIIVEKEFPALRSIKKIKLLPCYTFAERRAIPRYTTAVYFIFSVIGELSYIGCSDNLRMRLSYQHDALDVLIKEGDVRLINIYYLKFPTHSDARALESKLIAHYKPALNKPNRKGVVANPFLDQVHNELLEAQR